MGMRQPRRRTTALLQSLDDGLVGLYADLNLCPRRLVGCARQGRLGLLQVGLGCLETGTEGHVLPTQTSFRKDGRILDSSASPMSEN